MPLRAPKGFIDETDPKVCQIGHPAPPWLVNYADLMTELVCFFVILYALSASLNKGITNSKDKIDEMMKNGKINGEVEVNKKGLKITLEEKGGASFFQSGSAETTAEIDQYISQVAPVLKSLIQDHDLTVQGHSDNQRISNEFFDSNWELSTARATSVARLLIDKYGFPASHVGAAGYGEYRPIASNDTPEGRSKNRRVVLFISADKSEVPLKGVAMAPEPAGAPPAAQPGAQSPESAPAAAPSQPSAPVGGEAPANQ